MLDQALALLDQVSAPYDEGVLNIIWHTYSIIQRYTPQLVPAMRAARQQQGEISFTSINALQYPLALLAMALLPVIIWLAWHKELPAPIGELAATIALTLLGNAVVCGVLASPHDRYGARVAWRGWRHWQSPFRWRNSERPALGHRQNPLKLPRWPEFLRRPASMSNAAAELAPTGKLRVAIAIAPAPSAQFAVKDDAGNYRGVAIILGRALAEKLGVPVETHRSRRLR